jgi:hypothetical protein
MIIVYARERIDLVCEHFATEPEHSNKWVQEDLVFSADHNYVSPFFD